VLSTLVPPRRVARYVLTVPLAGLQGCVAGVRVCGEEVEVRDAVPSV
jgi:hypothetical protein